MCEANIPIVTCPRCIDFFSPFLRFQVARFSWFGLRKKVFALICRNCKEIVGWE
jgi:hypothetical protein